jgi:hypothetical protein
MKEWKTTSVGQSFASGRLQWYRTFVDADGNPIEADGGGFPPADIRQQILQAEGEWEVVVVPGNPTKVALILREILELSPQQALECARNDSGVVYCGTKVEAQWISMKLREAGIPGVGIRARVDKESQSNSATAADGRLSNALDLIRSLFQATLELQDEHAVEVFMFSNENHVVATLGTKDGPICGPGLLYRVTEDDVLEILDHRGTVLCKWEKIQVRGDTLNVVCAGRTKVFSITRPPANKRYLP